MPLRTMKATRSRKRRAGATAAPDRSRAVKKTKPPTIDVDEALEQMRMAMADLPMMSQSRRVACAPFKEHLIFVSDTRYRPMLGGMHRDVSRLLEMVVLFGPSDLAVTWLTLGHGQRGLPRSEEETPTVRWLLRPLGDNEQRLKLMLELWEVYAFEVRFPHPAPRQDATLTAHRRREMILVSHLAQRCAQLHPRSVIFRAVLMWPNVMRFMSRTTPQENEQELLCHPAVPEACVFYTPYGGVPYRSGPPRRVVSMKLPSPDARRGISSRLLDAFCYVGRRNRSYRELYAAVQHGRTGRGPTQRRRLDLLVASVQERACMLPEVLRVVFEYALPAEARSVCGLPALLPTPFRKPDLLQRQRQAQNRHLPARERHPALCFPASVPMLRWSLPAPGEPSACRTALGHMARMSGPYAPTKARMERSMLPALRVLARCGQLDDALTFRHEAYQLVKGPGLEKRLPGFRAPPRDFAAVERLGLPAQVLGFQTRLRELRFWEADTLALAPVVGALSQAQASYAIHLQVAVRPVRGVRLVLATDKAADLATAEGVVARLRGGRRVREVVYFNWGRQEWELLSRATDGGRFMRDPLNELAWVSPVREVEGYRGAGSMPAYHLAPPEVEEAEE